VTEKCVPGTRKAVETTGGERWPTFDSCRGIREDVIQC
jgi:hypothetical protein